MGDWFDFNLNNTVHVKLTDAGRDAYRAHRQAVYAVLDLPVPEDGRPEDREGYSRWQLWELMQVFGPHIELGMMSPLFEKNNIRLPAPKPEQKP